jgi:probable HAF family extracellular repeat protein
MPVYTYTTLDDPLAAGQTLATGISSSGLIVGYYHDASGNHGFLYSGGTYTTINDPSPCVGLRSSWCPNGQGPLHA